MNVLIEKGLIKEMPCGSNFSYILNDNSIFLSTAYKVLLSQTNSCFVKCMKMTFNGQIQVYYLTQTLKPLSEMLMSLNADSFLTIVANLITDIIAVKHNGFLSCCNIETSYDHIFVDPQTFKVSLVYLPLSEKMFPDNTNFETKVRTDLVRAISEMYNIRSNKTARMAQYLSNGMLSMEDLYSKLKGGNSTDFGGYDHPDVHHSGQKCRIVAMNAPGRVELAVNKDKYIIGKNPASVDGVVSFNKMISRVHCCVDKNGSEYTITDLNSSNGTYVNNMKLQPKVPYPIKNGDIIRMANSDFQVSIS